MNVGQGAVTYLNIKLLPLFMNIRFAFYIPEGLKDTEEVKEIERLLYDFKSAYNIIVNKQIINRSEENQIKSQFLWRLSVVKRIGIKQTIRTKSLYPQLVIFNKDKPITFYPQTYGGEHITITEFLEQLLKNRIKCLHDEKELKEILMGVRKLVSGEVDVSELDIKVPKLQEVEA